MWQLFNVLYFHNITETQAPGLYLSIGIYATLSDETIIDTSTCISMDIITSVEYLEPSLVVSSKYYLSFIITYEHTAASQFIFLITTVTAFGTLSVIVVVTIIVIVCIIMYLKKRNEEYETGGMERSWMI